jgi:hypothetical protein
LIGYGVTANIAASHTLAVTVRGSSGFDSPYPNFFFFSNKSSILLIGQEKFLI